MSEVSVSRVSVPNAHVTNGVVPCYVKAAITMAIRHRFAGIPTACEWNAGTFCKSDVMSPKDFGEGCLNLSSDLGTIHPNQFRTRSLTQSILGHP